MTKIARFVLWLCKNFTRQELQQIILELQKILAEREPEVKPRDAFRQEHPHYRDFYVDPLAPLTEPPVSTPLAPTLDWRDLCADRQKERGRPLSPVRRQDGQKIPKKCRCSRCGAPADYLYLNDGKKATQLRCKVCGALSQIERRHRKNKTGFWCPHCQSALYRWKERPDCTIYKCPKDDCPHFLQKKAALNWNEKLLQKMRLSQFKLRYQYRAYDFPPQRLAPSAPDRPHVDLTRIHRSTDLLGLVLAFHISFALSARKTAQVLRQVFGVAISYQTVLNYTQAAAYYCHRFNLTHKAPLGETATGDETYIRLAGKHHYTFLFLDPKTHQITSYHVAPERDVLAASASMGEAARTLPDHQALHFITDGNPSYQAALHFLNSHREKDRPAHTLDRVLGLQNLDDISEKYRPFKQLIERLNRTYKYHVRSACGFATRNGAVAVTVLFVTFYNFLRPHMALKYRVPIELEELKNIASLQGRWNKILQLASLS